MRTWAGPVDGERRGSIGRFWLLVLVLVAGGALGSLGTVSASAAVTVGLAGSGTGTVTSDPAGIACSNTPGEAQSDCDFNFAFFSTPKFTATADPPYVFGGWSGVSGGTCMSGLENPCSFPWGIGTYTITASFVEAPDPPVTAVGPATGMSYYGATLNGRVNPNDFAVGACRFEYGKTADYGETAACLPGDIPAGTSDVPVSAKIGYLEPSTVYHYRLTADNPGGRAKSADRTFRTAPAPEDSCDNAAIRAEQGVGTLLLADCMAYEQVSVGDSWGLGVNPLIDAISDSGTRASFTAQAFGDPDSVPGPFNIYTAERRDSGWNVSTNGPDAANAYGAYAGSTWTLAPDLGTVLMPEATRFGSRRGEVQWTYFHLDGSHTAATGKLVPLVSSGNRDPQLGMSYKFDGASDDLSTIAFSVAGLNSHTFFPDEYPFADGSLRTNLYAVRGAGTATPVLEVVNRDTNPAPGVPGSIIGGACGAGMGGSMIGVNGTAQRAMSGDGSVIYFTARPDSPATGSCPIPPPPRRLFKRVDGATTVAVSASQCERVSPACAGSGDDIYNDASVDGSVVFFRSTRQLTDSDLDTTSDLYVYDQSPPAGQAKLLQVSAGEVTAGHPTVGSGANVTSFLASSADGSRAYFAATGVLTGANSRGISPVSGQRNIYVFERNAAHPSGRIAFVATLAATDRIGDASAKRFVALPNQGADSDGRLLLFNTAAALVDGDDDTADDVYRYDDSSGELLCLSCIGDGAYDAFINQTGGPVGSAPAWRQLGRSASGDGSAVVFVTEEPLLDEDRNDALDAYLWKDGNLSLVTAGTRQSGIATWAGDSYSTAGISSDGKSVFFTTDEPLVRSDVNRQVDLYVARVGGGFASPPPPSAKCEVLSDACQAPSDESAALPAIGSASPTVFGNLPPAPRIPHRTAKIRVKKPKVVRGSRARLSVKVPGAGRIRVSGSGLKRAKKTVKSAKTYRVTVKLSSRSKRILRRKHRVKARATVRFTPTHGRASRVRVHLTFEQPKAKRHNARKGGR